MNAREEATLAHRLNVLKGYLETVKLELEGVQWYLKQSQAPEGAAINHHRALLNAMHQLLTGALGVFGADAKTMSELNALELFADKIRAGKRSGSLPSSIGVPDYDDGAY